MTYEVSGKSGSFNAQQYDQPIFKVPNRSVFAQQSLGKVEVEYDGHDYYIIHSNRLKTRVLGIDVSNELQGIPIEKLQKILNFGQLAISKIGEDYAIRFQGRLAGGGPFGAMIAYVATNVAGGAMILAGMVTAPIGGAALVAAGAATVTAAPAVLAITLATPTP
jgi:hypothetical protein